MNILVTGSNGQLGRSLQNLGSHHPDLTFYYTDVDELDITNEAYVNKYFSEISLDYCINCAAYTNVDKAESDKALAYEINVEAVRNLANACLKNDVTLIHISTDFVFDGLKNTPYNEEDKPNPLNVYGLSKLKGEQYVQKILKQYFIIRTSWVYSEYGHNFVKTMLRLGKERDQLSVVSDQFGSPTYAGDLAECILHLIMGEYANYGIYHYSNKGKISWYDFAVEIFRISNLSIKVNGILSSEYKTSADRPKNSVLDNTKIQQIQGVKIYSWDASLKKCHLIEN